MPHLTFKNVNNLEKNDIVKMCNNLSEIVECPKDWFTFNFINDVETYIYTGELTKEIILIDVSWFPRSEEVQGKVVECLTSTIKNKNKKENLEIITMFTELDRNKYYES
ncbi:MAG: DUF1904 family protein [Lachnospirales bacterium]